MTAQTAEEPVDELSIEIDAASTQADVSSEALKKKKKGKVATQLELLHCDIIRDDFWEKYGHILRD